MSSTKDSPVTPVYKTMMAEDSVPNKNKQDFQFFPAYAKFLLENKLRELSVEQLKLSRENNLPLLKHLQDLSEEALIEIGIKTTTELLSYCAENKMNSYIEVSSKRWLNNQLPAITKSEINAQDVTLFNFIRRKLFRSFITYYTSDIKLAIKILDEIDSFTVEADAVAFKTLFNIQSEMFRQSQALAQIGNWQWNLKTKKLTWSDELYKIYELELQTPIVSDQISCFIHPDDQHLVNKYMQVSAETFQPHDFYYRIILKDGREKVLHAKGEVLLNANGVAEEMFGTLQDVTDQKQKEKELEDSRKFIEKIADVSPCIITVYNVHSGNYLFINKAVETLLGYDVENFTKDGRNFIYSMIHPKDVHAVQQNNKQLIAEANNTTAKPFEKVKDFKYRVKHKDGAYRWIHTFSTVFNRDKNGKVQDVLNISIDVTESQLLTLRLADMNEEIKQKEFEHQRMINEIEDYAILMIDKNGIIQNWNKGAEKIKGYTADEIIGKNFRIFYRKEDQQRRLPETLLEEAIKNGKANHEGWRVRKDGTTFWGNIVITALHDENNNVIGFTKVTRNLTDKKIAEDQLKEYARQMEKQNEELQRINIDLDSFTYTASHDLQEPLRKIKTFCNLIETKAGKTFSEDTAAYFNRIIAAVSRMQNLIDSLLNYSRTTSAEKILIPTDLNNIVEEVKKELAEMITEKDAKIIYEPLPVIKVIPLQFQQLFLNIISNAIKYSRADVPPVIHITSEQFSERNEDKTQKLTKISVSDNGIGFEQKYADNIFKLFQRLHGRTEYSGTGIGLAICKKIVENHNGTINAISEPGKGSTFIITIPSND
ncbi:MAG TPA: PAS domain-containing protein [Parafilimonas sp.]|nr:PAS domain-containing protein [Parafilimonas sp.]